MTKRTFSPLGDVVHASIASAWLEGGSWRETVAELELAPGVQEAARGFWKLIERRGGWWHPIYVRPCAVCGQPLVARSPTQHTHRRRCHAAAINARRRERGYTSSPWVAKWRSANPARELGLRIRERFSDPHTVSLRTVEQRAAAMRSAIASRQRADDELRQLADSHGAGWSSDDERWLVEHQDWSSTAAAAELGRTSSSVRHRRRILRQRGLLPPRGREPVESAG